MPSASDHRRRRQIAGSLHSRYTESCEARSLLSATTAVLPLTSLDSQLGDDAPETSSPDSPVDTALECTLCDASVSESPGPEGPGTIPGSERPPTDEGPGPEDESPGALIVFPAPPLAWDTIIQFVSCFGPDGQDPFDGFDFESMGEAGPEIWGPGSEAPVGWEPGSEGPEGWESGIEGPEGWEPGSEGPEGWEPGIEGPEGWRPGIEGPVGWEPGSEGPEGWSPGIEGPVCWEPGSEGPEGWEPESEVNGEEGMYCWECPVGWNFFSPDSPTPFSPDPDSPEEPAPDWTELPPDKFFEFVNIAWQQLPELISRSLSEAFEEIPSSTEVDAEFEVFVSMASTSPEISTSLQPDAWYGPEQEVGVPAAPVISDTPELRPLYYFPALAGNQPFLSFHQQPSRQVLSSNIVLSDLEPQELAMKITPDATKGLQESRRSGSWLRRDRAVEKSHLPSPLTPHIRSSIPVTTTPEARRAKDAEVQSSEDAENTESAPDHSEKQVPIKASAAPSVSAISNGRSNQRTRFPDVRITEIDRIMTEFAFEGFAQS